MSRTFGKASDFYRVRIITLEEETALDFDWRDDVLYCPRKDHPTLIDTKYSLQVVELDSRDKIVLGEFSDMDEAVRTKEAAAEDLKILTKMEFEKKYNLLDGEGFASRAEDEYLVGSEIERKKDAPRNLS